MSTQAVLVYDFVQISADYLQLISVPYHLSKGGAVIHYAREILQIDFGIE